jgi:hypothetical protein
LHDRRAEVINAARLDQFLPESGNQKITERRPTKPDTRSPNALLHDEVIGLNKKELAGNWYIVSPGGSYTKSDFQDPVRSEAQATELLRLSC